MCGLWDRSGRQQHWLAQRWAATMLRVTFSPVQVVGEEKLGDPVAVYASNHLSYMDTPVLFAKLPFQFRILAKQGLWKIPFVGWYLQRSGQVPIDCGESAVGGGGTAAGGRGAEGGNAAGAVSRGRAQSGWASAEVGTRAARLWRCGRGCRWCRWR